MISATQALIALRRYETERGTLPEKLSELVPIYLPKVPRDHYDGREIRYSREFRAIWSVGRNTLSITESHVLASSMYSAPKSAAMPMMRSM